MSFRANYHVPRSELLTLNGQTAQEITQAQAAAVIIQICQNTMFVTYIFIEYFYHHFISFLHINLSLWVEQR